MFAGHFKMLIRLSGLLPVRTTLGQKMVWQHGMTGALRRMATSAPAPTLMATPTRALIDEPIMLEARHLTPHCPVTVRARMRCEEGDLWEALAHYYADRNGVLNLSRDEAQGGSYTGCEPMGLFWSLFPATGEREGLRLRKKNVETPYTFQVSLLNGHVSSHSVRSHDEERGKGEELAAVTVERWYTAPGVRRIDIREEGLVGTLFLPPAFVDPCALYYVVEWEGEVEHNDPKVLVIIGPGPFPAVLDFWGMGGGLVEYRSALQASRGIASFTLAYVGHKDIPGLRNVINVGDDYIQAAFQLLQNHPQVCGSRLAVVGKCYGGYLAQHIATHLPVNLRCVIVINGSIGHADENVKVDGKVVSFRAPKALPSHDLPGYVDYKETSHPKNHHLGAKIKMGNLRCPLLLLTSEDDGTSSVLENAAQVKEELQAANKSHLLTWVSYPGAGHMLEPPYSPLAGESLWIMRPNKLMACWGGHTAPHAAAQEDAWKKVQDFLGCHLRGGD